MNPDHIQWLRKTDITEQTGDGKDVEVWEFHHQADDTILSAWAKHFREHYCSDSEIDVFRSGTGKSRKDYLIDLKFPAKDTQLGPGIRSGDFAEILVADFLEYILQYQVPRTRYDRRTTRDEPTKGCDVIGFKFVSKHEPAKDILTIYECKAGLSNSSVAKERLQEAIDDSAKDPTRKAESLNAMKQRLFDRKLLDEVAKVERFQPESDHPYQQIYGAAAILDNTQYQLGTVKKVVTSSHPHPTKLCLLIIKGNNLMPLVHDLYERAANEA